MSTTTQVRPQIAVQMYTVREQFRADPVRCLADISDAGFDAVEFAGFAGLTPTRLRAALDGFGLRAISSHLDIAVFADLDRVLEVHHELGCDAVVIQQAATSDFADADAVARLAERANAWGARLAEAGLRLAYHGYHDFEREFAVEDGVRRYDRFVALTDPGLVDIQLDTFWIQHVGDDPVATLRRLAGRVPMLHTKEVRAPESADDTADAPIGAGTTDWPAVLAAAIDSGVRWLVIEQEKDPANALRDIRISRRNLLAVLDSLPVTR